MKVIGINGSPRRSRNSAILLENALKGAASKGAETTLVHLSDLNFSGCQSCFACKLLGGKSFGRCAIQDDLAGVLQDILSADAVIISSPIYYGDVTGQVRNLFERLWFPGLMYRKDGACAYDKRVKVGMIYTQNVPDPDFYQTMFEQHKSTFERFLGESTYMVAADTKQFDNYDLYVGDMFDPAQKQARHDTVFPVDCEKAFAMGAALAE